MKFSYKQYGQNTIRPVIPVKLVHKERSIKYEVLVDSGADVCLFHAEIGEALGIDIKKGKLGTITGVGGKSTPCYWHTVEVDVGGWVSNMHVGFLPTIGGRSAPYGILGQQGFFEQFTVKFDYKKEEVEVKNRP